MEETITRTVAVFSRPFIVPGHGEPLPAGDYDVETELLTPPDPQHPEAWKASVQVTLRPRTALPGLSAPLTVSLADLDAARARDKLTGRSLPDVFVEEMLADPMVRLVMQADGVSEAQLRHLYAGLTTSRADLEAPGAGLEVPDAMLAPAATGHSPLEAEALS